MTASRAARYRRPPWNGRGRWWISVLIAAGVIGLIVAIFLITKSHAR